MTQQLTREQLDYVPHVGEECLCCWNSAPELYYKVKVICTEGDSIIFRWLEGDNEGCLGENEQGLFAGCMIFKPLPAEEEVEREKILTAWKRQSLENAHDTEASVLTVGEMIDFIVELEGE
jgi:hypothetical protein